MAFKYRMFNAPSSYTLEDAVRLGCNWAIVHSAGIEAPATDPVSGRSTDMYPIYFEDYPKVAQIRHHEDAGWIEPLRRDVRALSDRAVALGLKVAFHMYEPVLPHVFESEYPEIVSFWRRPTQQGVQYVHTLVDPDNSETWKLVRGKYAELAREFPQASMFILTTWDGTGTFWCVPQAKMSVAERLARMVQAAQEGVDSVRPGVTIVFRLWGRNWPPEMYRDGHRLIAEATGVANAAEIMQPVSRAYNDPEKVLPDVLRRLPGNVPIMYKSTRIDIAEAQELSLDVGKFPASREQILEVSYEMYHVKRWPWCKVRHIRRGLDAARQHKLAGYLILPVNMGNDARHEDPESGNVGRMNTWLAGEILKNDGRDDARLVADWLKQEFGVEQPREVVDILLGMDDLADRGVQWGANVPNRLLFASLHSTKLYWMFDGWANPAFPYRMAKPTRQVLEEMIGSKHQAHDDARLAIERLHACRAAMHEGLYDEMVQGLSFVADLILLCRDWHSYLLMQYGLELGLWEPNRVNLGQLSRYAESFIKNLARLKDAEAGKYAMQRLSFPDPFPLT